MNCCTQYTFCVDKHHSPASTKTAYEKYSHYVQAKGNNLEICYTNKSAAGADKL
jgi:hypothetical protein